ncbi:unnamed protein product [Vitrella brassicaformis CCMP3155]|uniref:Uncharacterized protein n=2 Tax=Vitrella brassicaformis TaxID=1169539 RepID=A0A0G4G7M8_VITBC|nr:unnamed protein product [Vitrella brassicaformis CCMP3155]|eukprot:CEM24704.1 unnamed protein product [Vitrella brassicaformis CCMP3155]
MGGVYTRNRSGFHEPRPFNNPPPQPNNPRRIRRGKEERARKVEKEVKKYSDIYSAEIHYPVDTVGLLTLIQYSLISAYNSQNQSLMKDEEAKVFVQQLHFAITILAKSDLSVDSIQDTCEATFRTIVRKAATAQLYNPRAASTSYVWVWQVVLAGLRFLIGYPGESQDRHPTTRHLGGHIKYILGALIALERCRLGLRHDNSALGHLYVSDLGTAVLARSSLFLLSWMKSLKLPAMSCVALDQGDLDSACPPVVELFYTDEGDKKSSLLMENQVWHDIITYRSFKVNNRKHHNETVLLTTHTIPTTHLGGVCSSKWDAVAFEAMYSRGTCSIQDIRRFFNRKRGARPPPVVVDDLVRILMQPSGEARRKAAIEWDIENERFQSHDAELPEEDDGEETAECWTNITANDSLHKEEDARDPRLFERAPSTIGNASIWRGHVDGLQEEKAERERHAPMTPEDEKRAIELIQKRLDERFERHQVRHMHVMVRQGLVHIGVMIQEIRTYFRVPTADPHVIDEILEKAYDCRAEQLEKCNMPDNKMKIFGIGMTPDDTNFCHDRATHLLQERRASENGPLNLWYEGLGERCYILVKMFGHRRYFRILSATEEGVKEAIQEAVAWRNDIRRRIGWTDADMSDYVFASQDEAEKARDAVDKRLDSVQDHDGWPDRMGLYATRRSDFRVYIRCQLVHDGRVFHKNFPVLSADRDDMDRAIEMAVEYREWVREKVRSLKQAAEEAKAKDRADKECVASRTRGKKRKPEECPTSVPAAAPAEQEGGGERAEGGGDEDDPMDVDQGGGPDGVDLGDKDFEARDDGEADGGGDWFFSEDGFWEPIE